MFIHIKPITATWERHGEGKMFVVLLIRVSLVEHYILMGQLWYKMR